MSEFEFYDWKKTNSYTRTRLFFVVGGRSIGKTYGARKVDIEDYIKRGRQFVQLVRYSSELSAFERSYFGKLEHNREFPGWRFKIESHTAYIAKNESEDWRECGYFLALSDEQNIKKQTFPNVYNITLDEAVIDRKRFPRKRYLPKEYVTLLGIVSSCLRETPSEPKPARIRLLGNACDLTCPYFESLGISNLPEYGKHFYHNRRVMFDLVEPTDAKRFRDETTVGQLMFDEDEAGVFFDNSFLSGFSSQYLLEKMPKDSRLSFVLRFETEYAVYLSLRDAIVYVTRKIPGDLGKAGSFALTREDMTIDYPKIRRSSALLKELAGYSDVNLLRYDSPATMAGFSRVLDFLGCR